MPHPIPTNHDQPTPTLDPDLLDYLLDIILQSIPHTLNDKPETRAAHRHAARLALLALKPTDPFAAMLAAQTIAAHYAIMDNLRRAAQPDVSDHTATRLRGNAGTLNRAMHATLRALHQHQNPPAATAPATRRPAPLQPPTRATPPTLPTKDPEHAPPSRPYRRFEDMTLSERRAHYGYKGDPSATALTAAAAT